MITLDPETRRRLRDALLKHRQGYALNEASYVETALEVALNTYKKCVEEPVGTELRLKRRTLAKMLKVAKIDPASLGLDFILPVGEALYGGYEPSEFKDLVGCYFLHRRSFLTARNIVRGVIEIRIDEKKRCLAFEEYNNYISDAGLQDDSHYTGEIYVNETRSLFSLHAVQDGQLRLLMTQGPVRATGENGAVTVRGRLRLRGTILTHGKAKGAWQPTVSAVALESLPPNIWKGARAQCRTIPPEDPDFKAAALEVAYAEEYASVMTPLMWSRLPPQPSSSHVG